MYFSGIFMAAERMSLLNRRQCVCVSVNRGAGRVLNNLLSYTASEPVQQIQSSAALFNPADAQRLLNVWAGYITFHLLSKKRKKSYCLFYPSSYLLVYSGTGNSPPDTGSQEYYLATLALALVGLLLTGRRLC